MVSVDGDGQMFSSEFRQKFSTTVIVEEDFPAFPCGFPGLLGLQPHITLICFLLAFILVCSFV